MQPEKKEMVMRADDAGVFDVGGREAVVHWKQPE
jgi:hypothetical protein